MVITECEGPILTWLCDEKWNQFTLRGTCMFHDNPPYRCWRVLSNIHMWELWMSAKFCACSYSRWGNVSMNKRWPDQLVASEEGSREALDRIHWVILRSVQSFMVLFFNSSGFVALKSKLLTLIVVRTAGLILWGNMWAKCQSRTSNICWYVLVWWSCVDKSAPLMHQTRTVRGFYS